MKNFTIKKIISALLFGFTVLIIFAEEAFLAGGESGLYEIHNFRAKNIWDKASVYKICRAGNQWLFLTDNGIAASKNLQDFYYLNNALPKKIIKSIDKNGNKSFSEKMQQLKDLEVHPSNPNIFITASSESVFLTADSGKTWTNLGCNGKVNGIKAVCVLDIPNAKGENILTVFVSHALYGIAYKQPAVNVNVWYELNDGLEEGPEGIEEVADITFNQSANIPQVFCCQTFSGKIYKLDWNKKKFTEVLNVKQDNSKLLCMDSLIVSENTIMGIHQNGLFENSLLVPKIQSYANQNLFKDFHKAKKLLASSNYLCAYIPQRLTPFTSSVSISELWLLHNSKKQKNGYLKAADGKKGIYIPVHQVNNETKFAEHLKTIKENKLNAIVIDMKDEAGFVRYKSDNEEIKKFGGERYTLDLENFIAKTKEEKLYLIARIVLFKDKNLYRYKNGEYAVKDKTTNKPWQGYNSYGGEKEMIEEYWVDPYNEDVWKYNIDIAEELCKKGFDEIQFDYIRFPTDGDNLGNAVYPACENGMDKVSALMSFLSYARKRIKAPISIDIYGSNGWYRTGARTGQEVELIAEYVDVICPMFYPSHFSQNFLAYKPAEERPYRIYYQGSYRNKFIARNKLIVRPWAQAFYIPVSYDKKYYDSNYVKRQILGIRDSIDEGYIYWNNSGRYLDVRPDGEEL